MPINYGSGVKFPWMVRKIQHASFVIEQWLKLSDGRVYHSISGGKDSLVVGHLIRQQYPECPMIWINQGPLAEWPDCVELLKLLKNQGWNIIELCPAYSLLNLYKQYGLPLNASMTSNLDKTINKALLAPVFDWRGDCYSGYSLGLRRESRGRTMLIHSRGELFQRKDKLWQCLPIAFWSTADIWHYIDQEHLPYPAMYDLDRMTIRNGPPIGTTGSCRGRLTHVRRYHPEFWDLFCQHFPEIVNYA